MRNKKQYTRKCQTHAPNSNQRNRPKRIINKTDSQPPIRLWNFLYNLFINIWLVWVTTFLIILWVIPLSINSIIGFLKLWDDECFNAIRTLWRTNKDDDEK